MLRAASFEPSALRRGISRIRRLFPHNFLRGTFFARLRRDTDKSGSFPEMEILVTGGIRFRRLEHPRRVEQRIFHASARMQATHTPNGAGVLEVGGQSRYLE